MKIKSILTKGLAVALSCSFIFSGMAFAEDSSDAWNDAGLNGTDVDESELAEVMEAYGLTGEDVLALANVYKQTNEGNDPGLDDQDDWYETEFKLAQIAAAMGVGEAAKWIGEIYQGGHVEGVDEDEAVDLAIQWWEKTAELGEPSGWTNIGLIYGHKNIPGGGSNFGTIEQDDEKAFEYYMMGYEGGCMKAPRYIAQAYDQGVGVEQDYAKACEFYTIAAELGDISSNYYVGQYYENGMGVDEDLEQAAYYYGVCADSAKTVPGVADARYKMGEFCENGLGGLDEDLDAAIEWYQMAAEDGSEDAQEALERLGATDDEDD